MTLVATSGECSCLVLIRGLHGMQPPEPAMPRSPPSKPLGSRPLLCALNSSSLCRDPQVDMRHPLPRPAVSKPPDRAPARAHPPHLGPPRHTRPIRRGRASAATGGFGGKRSTGWTGRCGRKGSSAGSASLGVSLMQTIPALAADEASPSRRQTWRPRWVRPGSTRTMSARLPSAIDATIVQPGGGGGVGRDQRPGLA